MGGDRVSELGQGGESVAHIAFPAPDHPEALCAAGKLATKGMRCRTNSGDQGLQPLGEREARVLRMKIAELRSPRSAGVQGAAA